jgi:hypothetical protein
MNKKKCREKNGTNSYNSWTRYPEVPGGINKVSISILWAYGRQDCRVQNSDTGENYCRCRSYKGAWSSVYVWHAQLLPGARAMPSRVSAENRWSHTMGRFCGMHLRADVSFRTLLWLVFMCSLWARGHVRKAAHESTDAVLFKLVIVMLGRRGGTNWTSLISSR